MTWWDEARFGMCIHWGVYAVPADVYQGEEIDFIGEWIMNMAKIPDLRGNQWKNAKEFINVSK